MEYILICLVAFLGSCLTFFSGFGLGTVLLPVFAIFFPIDVAIALTAIVHLLNNLFKLLLVGKHADLRIILRFGIPSIVTALLGAYLLTFITDLPSIYQYKLAGKMCTITPVKVIISLLLIFFALFDLIPRFANLQVDKKYLPLGGLLSGFFGGLSGHQGALRSAFLIRTTLSKEAFIATGVVIACMIDVSRLWVYGRHFMKHGGDFDYPIIAAATISAFAGAFIGNRLLKKITIKLLQKVVGIMLLLFALLMGAGII